MATLIILKPKVCVFNPVGRKGLEITVCIAKLSDRVQSSSDFDQQQCRNLMSELEHAVGHITPCFKVLTPFFRV